MRPTEPVANFFATFVITSSAFLRACSSVSPLPETDGRVHLASLFGLLEQNNYVGTSTLTSELDRMLVVRHGMCTQSTHICFFLALLSRARGASMNCFHTRAIVIWPGFTLIHGFEFLAESDQECQFGNCKKQTCMKVSTQSCRRSSLSTSCSSRGHWSAAKHSLSPSYCRNRFSCRLQPPRCKLVQLAVRTIQLSTRNHLPTGRS